MLAIGFEGPVAHPIAVAVEIGEAPDIDRPEIERRFAIDGPLCQHPARAAARGNAKGVETGPDEHVGTFRRDAEDEIAVGREALRAVDHLLDANGFKRGDTFDRRKHMLLEMIEIIIEQAELPVIRHIAGHPALRIGLIAAHDQSADFFLEIGAPVRDRGSSVHWMKARRSFR